jgi:hypothetical protein
MIRSPGARPARTRADRPPARRGAAAEGRAPIGEDGAAQVSPPPPRSGDGPRGPPPPVTPMRPNSPLGAPRLGARAGPERAPVRQRVTARREGDSVAVPCTVPTRYGTWLPPPAGRLRLRQRTGELERGPVHATSGAPGRPALRGSPTCAAPPRRTAPARYRQVSPGLTRDTASARAVIAASARWRSRRSRPEALMRRTCDSATAR